MQPLAGLPPRPLGPAITTNAPGIGPATAAQQAAASASAAAAKPGEVTKRPYNKKPLRTDRAAPEKISYAVQDSPLLNALTEQQKRVDDAIQRRRVEVREAVQRVERVKRRLRITVTNTHANQPSTASEGPTSAGESTGPSEPPCWTLLIHGRILDPDPSTAAAAGTAQTAAGAAAAGAVGPLGSAGAVGAHAAGANLSGAAVAGAGATPAAAAAAAALGATGGAAGAGAPGSAAPAAGAQPAAGAAGAAPGAGPAPGQAAAQAAANQALAPKYPLTAYLRRVEVILDPDPEQQATSSGRILVWDKALHVGPHRDGLEVRRTGTTPCRAKVIVTLDQQPEHVALPPPLASILGVTHETRPKVQLLMHQYIKAHRLQDTRTPGLVKLPSELAQLLGGRMLKLSELMDGLSSCLMPIPPIEITHTVTLCGPSPCPAQVVDCEVDVLAGTAGGERYLDAGGLQEREAMERIDSEMAAVLKRIADARRRRAVLLGFAQAPAEFIEGVIASQARDLRISRVTSAPALQASWTLAQNPLWSIAQREAAFASAAASYAQEFEVERRTEVFRGKWVEDAVVRYLQRKAQGV